MSNILTYPLIPIVAGDDMMVISDVSVKGNPTRSVSVNQLGAYIGAGGGGAAGVTSFNAKVGAITLVGGTNITLGTVGNTITINSGAGGGTVTSVAATFGGNAFSLAGSPITAAGTLAITPTGGATQYVNGLGNLALLSSIPTSVTLAVTRTTGDATLTGNVLDIPNYGSGSGGGTVTSLVVDRTSGDSTLIAGVLNIPNYANTTNFSLASDTGTTSAMAAGNTLTIEGGTGIETVVSGNPGGARSVLNLSDTTVTAGSYTFSALNIDAQGRITGASSGTRYNPNEIGFFINRHPATNAIEMMVSTEDSTIGSTTFSIAEEGTITGAFIITASSSYWNIGYRLTMDINVPVYYDIGGKQVVKTAYCKRIAVNKLQIEFFQETSSSTEILERVDLVVADTNSQGVNPFNGIDLRVKRWFFGV